MKNVKDTKAVRPEDLMPDGVNHVGNIRKGSFGAILANIDVLESEDVSDTVKEDALIIIRDLLTNVNTAMNLHDYMIWKNQDVQNIMDDVANN